MRDEARWRYLPTSARWHLVSVMRVPDGEAARKSLTAIVAAVSVCGNARLRSGASWALTQPACERFVRCAACCRLARRYEITNREDEVRR